MSEQSISSLKRCTKCGQEFPNTSEFWNKNGRWGLHTYCKTCSKASARQWEKDNAEYVRARRQTPEYKIRHASEERTRQARALQAQGRYDADDIQQQYKRQKGCCYYCHKKLNKTFQVEHVIPLSRGGSNGPDNIVVACPSCNHRKCDKLPHEWPEGGRLC